MKNESGFSLIELLIAVVLIAIIAALAIPSLLQSRRAANEASAVQTLRTIVSAQNAYFSGPGGTMSYATLDQLNAAGMVDSGLAGTGFMRSGYSFTHSLPATPSSFCADALPLPGDGARTFGADQSNLIWQDLSDATPCENGVLNTTGGISLRS